MVESPGPAYIVEGKIRRSHSGIPLKWVAPLRLRTSGRLRRTVGDCLGPGSGWRQIDRLNNFKGETILALSVLIPTRNRPDLLRQLLEQLDRQTLDATDFEVVVVDDGSDPPAVVEPGAHPYSLTLLRQEAAGPAAARNLGLGACRGTLTLLMNDDAVPEPDNLESHLRGHRQFPRVTAVLGSFGFTDRARQSWFVRLLDESSLLFDYPAMEHGQVYGWRHFWTCNLTVPTTILRAAGGFDAERFDEAIVEDVELGYRLAQERIGVLYWKEAKCRHDHSLTIDAYFHRMVRLGVYLHRMYAKHGHHSIFWQEPGFCLEKLLLRFQQRAELGYALVAEGIQRLRQREQESRPGAEKPEDLWPWKRLCRQMGIICLQAGVLLDRFGHDVFRCVRDGPSGGQPTTVVLVAHPDVRLTAATLQSLVRYEEPQFPIEVLVYDRQGDSGELLSALGTNAAVRLIRDSAAIRLDNDWFVIIHAGLEVGPGWLGRLLYHGAVDSRVACVGPVSNGGWGEQFHGRPTGPDGFSSVAVERYRDFSYARHLWPGLVALRTWAFREFGLCLDIKPNGALIDRRMTLRCHQAGWRNRIALDVFVLAEDGCEPPDDLPLWEAVEGEPIAEESGELSRRLRNDFEGLLNRVDVRQLAAELACKEELLVELQEKVRRHEEAIQQLRNELADRQHHIEQLEAQLRLAGGRNSPKV